MSNADWSVVRQISGLLEWAQSAVGAATEACTAAIEGDRRFRQTEDGQTGPTIRDIIGKLLCGNCSDRGECVLGEPSAGHVQEQGGSLWGGGDVEVYGRSGVRPEEILRGHLLHLKLNAKRPEPCH